MKSAGCMNRQVGLRAFCRSVIKFVRDVHFSIYMVHVLEPDDEMKTDRIVFIFLTDEIKGVTVNYISSECGVSVPEGLISRVAVFCFVMKTFVAFFTGFRRIWSKLRRFEPL